MYNYTCNLHSIRIDSSVVGQLMMMKEFSQIREKIMAENKYLIEINR